MRKSISFLLLFSIFLCFCIPAGAISAEAEAPEIESTSALLVQAGTGRVMFEKNADAKAYPASTTKIMTALLAIEALDPNQQITVSETAIAIDRDGSNMGLLNGEILTVEQLLYGLLVHSANDAANVLAETVAGDVSSFVDKMNARAAELGMTGTHFVNAHGYHDPEHYTTARDLATLAACAMKQPLFRTIVGTATYEIPPTNLYPETRILSNNNALINRMRDHRYFYKGATGIKTGSTSDAGSCLVSYAERNGIAYYCVTLHAPNNAEGNYSFIDTITLFDYGFQNFTMQKVSNSTEVVAIPKVKWARGDGKVILSAKEPLEILLPRGYDATKITSSVTTEQRIVAPVKKGDVLGRLVYYYDGTEVGSVDLVATENVKRSFSKMIFGTLWKWIFNAWVMIPLALVVAVLLMRMAAEEKKKRLAREKRRQQVRRDFYR